MKPLHVLVVEDSEDDTSLVRRELERGGYSAEVRRVEDRSTLVEALTEKRWDVILSDFTMPRFSGAEALKVVRSIDTHTPFIIVSGTVGEEAAVEAMRCGANDYVLKGNLRRLVGAVAREVREAGVRERYRASDAARIEAEHALQSMTEILPDALVMHHGDVIVHANRAFGEMLNEPAESFVGRRFSEIRGPLVDPSERGGLQEIELVRRDGRRIPGEITTTSTVPFAGSMVSVVLIRDASSRREMASRMMQMDRMVAIGTLAASIGHELNNPLAYVMGNVGYLRPEIERLAERLSPTRPVLPEDAASIADRLRELVAILGDVHEGTERLRDIVRDLKTFSRTSEPNEISAVEVGPVIESAIRMSSHEVKHRAVIVRDYDSVPAVQGNASRLGQVFLNLLVNAAQAISEGARQNNEIRIRATHDRTSVYLDVEDTGTGISGESVPHVFDPFFTTKAAGQGTGLGLAICRQILESFGGSIAIDSTSLRGTRMRVTLKRAAPEAQVRSTPSPDSKRRVRVLVVEDEPSLGRAIERILGAKHDVKVVQSGKDAITLLKSGVQVDVILSDLLMPEITGMDLHEAISISHPELARRMIFMTGGAYTPRSLDFLARLDNPRLDKPLDFKRVERLILQVLE